MGLFAPFPVFVGFNDPFNRPANRFGRNQLATGARARSSWRLRKCLRQRHGNRLLASRCRPPVFHESAVRPVSTFEQARIGKGRSRPTQAQTRQEATVCSRSKFRPIIRFNFDHTRQAQRKKTPETLRQRGSVASSGPRSSETGCGASPWAHGLAGLQGHRSDRREAPQGGAAYRAAPASHATCAARSPGGGSLFRGKGHCGHVRRHQQGQTVQGDCAEQVGGTSSGPQATRCL